MTGVIVALLICLAPASTSMAGETDDLREEIAQLKTLLGDLESRLHDREALEARILELEEKLGEMEAPASGDDIDELWDELDDMDDRMIDVEKKSAWDRINFHGDFRFRYDYENWTMPGQWSMKTLDEMFQGPLVPTMNELVGFLQNGVIPVAYRQPYRLVNDELYSVRLRLKMDAEIWENVQFHGRLSVKRYFGSGINDPIFNGNPNTVFYSFNASTAYSDTTLKLERAYVTWYPKKTPLVVTIGRQAATAGPPRELRENSVRQGTPPGLLIDAEIDGIMLGVKLAEYVKLPGALVRLCYGTGYEAGFGGGGKVDKSLVNMGMFRYATVEAMKDMKVAGGCMEFSLPGRDASLFASGYFRALDVTDISSGFTTNFPNPWDGTPKRVTATGNLGDIDLLGFSYQDRIFNVDGFVSMGYNKFHPNGMVSQYGFGALGNDDPFYYPGGDATNEKHQGWSIFAGFRVPIEKINGKLGFEFNHGSRYWFSFTQAADDINNKLSTRGNVYEPYYIQEINKNFFIRVGYQYYDYEYSLSGWHLGTPRKVETGGQYFYPVPSEIHNVYALMDFQF